MIGYLDNMRRFSKNHIEGYASAYPYSNSITWGVEMVYDIMNQNNVTYTKNELRYYYL